MSGSDCGNFFMWDKNSEAIIQWLPGDESGVVNCLEGHPHFPIIATSGLDHNVKIWHPMKPYPDGVSFILNQNKLMMTNNLILQLFHEDFHSNFMRFKKISLFLGNIFSSIVSATISS